MQHKVVPINAVAAWSMNKDIVTTAEPWQAATPKARELAVDRELFFRPIVQLLELGRESASKAIDDILTRIIAGKMSRDYLAVSKRLARKGKATPSRSVIFEWLDAYQQQGRVGLLSQHKGRVRQEYGWEAKAIELYNRPSKPSYSSVAIILQEQHGFADATYPNVRRFLKALPATLNTNSPARLGKHYHDLNRKGYTMRDGTVLLPGEVYEGDGHTCDCYVAHPNTGKPYRAELTVWIDVRSRYIVGWYLSDAESSLSTLFALSHALLSHDHVPAWVHIDNGSGYKSKLMSDESTGYYARFNITATFSIPGNSKGKGLVEHWFRTFRDHHDKHFNGGRDYCGNDMAAEINRRMGDMIAQGKRELRSLREYTESVAAFIDAYNNRATKTLDGKSPTEVWSELQPVSVELPAAAVIRPMKTCVAQRQMVRLHNRHYWHPILVDYHGHSVNVEYDIHTDDRVWIYDDKHRLICTAELKTKIDWLPQSRLDEARIKREAGRVKRLQKKIDLVRAEEADQHDQTHTLEALEKFDALDAELPQPQRSIVLDITDNDYLNGEE